MASYFLGYVRENFLQGNGEFKDNRVNSFGLYVQDDWRVSRRLTFDLGLRSDPFFPWKETKGHMDYKPDAYMQGLRSNVFTNAPRGLLFPGDSEIPEYGLRGTYKNFAPRLGFAYDVRGDGGLVSRGGVGMFFDSMQNGIYNNRFVDVSPFQCSGQPDSGPRHLYSDPYNGQVNPFPACPTTQEHHLPSPVQVATVPDPANGSQYQTPVSSGNLTVEHSCTAIIYCMAYVGSHASHLLESLDLSPTVYGSGGRRYFPEYSQLQPRSQDVNSSYNSMQLSLEKQFCRRGFPVGQLHLVEVYRRPSVRPEHYHRCRRQASPIPWYVPVVAGLIGGPGVRSPAPPGDRLRLATAE